MMLSDLVGDDIITFDTIKYDGEVYVIFHSDYMVDEVLDEDLIVVWGENADGDEISIRFLDDFVESLINEQEVSIHDSFETATITFKDVEG